MPDACHPVGNRAAGYSIPTLVNCIQWGARHDSILPYRSLRRACPCDTCAAAAPDAPHVPEAERLVDAQELGGQSVFLRWADGHETILLVGELRDLCRCARCAGEPDYPVSGA